MQSESVLIKTEQRLSRLQPAHPTVSLSPLVAVIVSAKQLRNVHRTLLSVSFREELKILRLSYLNH